MTPEKASKLRRIVTRIALRYRNEAYQNIKNEFPEEEREQYESVTDANYDKEMKEFEEALAAE